MASFLVAGLFFALHCFAANAVTSPVNVTSTIACPGKNISKCRPLAACAPTVIEETPTWPADCKGLHRQYGTYTAETCKAACYAQVNCTVWQFSNYLAGVLSTKTPKETFCYFGIPNADCRTRSSFKALAGQRIQRGAVEVTKPAVGLEITGLHKYLMDIGTQAERIARCKTDCYTNLNCGVWFYHTATSGTTSTSNCHVEKHGNKADDTIKTNTAFAKGVIAGEFILHYCPTADPQAKKPAGLPWKWIIPALILGPLALCGILFCLQPVPKTKKTRAVKISPKDEPEEEEVTKSFFVPQPMMVQRPVQPTYSLVQTPVVETVQTPVVSTSMQQVPTGRTRMEPTLAQTTPLMQPAYSSGYPQTTYPYHA